MEIHWYITRDGKKMHGPFTDAQLQQMASDGKILESDLVWREGYNNWVPVSQILRPVAHAGQPASPQASPPSAPGKYCHSCGASINVLAEVCPHCGVRQHISSLAHGISFHKQTNANIRDVSGTKLAAGLCGIFLGGLGIHKFILGLNTAGLVMLLITLLLCGIGAIIVGVVGLIEGIIYLVKSDEDFYQTYIVEKKQWF